jgi:phosphohistidine phosphatase
MKNLIFIRHAKAEEGNSSISDFERSLTTKGKVTSLLMAGRLKEKNSFTGIIITSPAFRALETAIIFSKVLGMESNKIIMSDYIYYKMNYHYLREILSGINDEVNSVMLFGHNPSFSEITSGLCMGECDIMPKCSIAGISFSVDKWSEIKQKNGKLEYFLKPETKL